MLSTDSSFARHSAFIAHWIHRQWWISSELILSHPVCFINNHAQFVNGTFPQVWLDSKPRWIVVIAGCQSKKHVANAGCLPRLNPQNTWKRGVPISPVRKLTHILSKRNVWGFVCYIYVAMATECELYILLGWFSFWYPLLGFYHHLHNQIWITGCTGSRASGKKAVRNILLGNQKRVVFGVVFCCCGLLTNDLWYHQDKRVMMYVQDHRDAHVQGLERHYISDYKWPEELILIYI